MARFQAEVGRTAGRRFASYDDLYAWSISRPEAFWAALWEFGGILASRRAGRVLVDSGRMPGARWFEGARLNFAENLLRHTDDQPALVALDEAGHRLELSHAQLRTEVARLAGALRRDGIRPGDRIAALLPHGAHAVIGMLASTAVGAIWSSCSPDFGVRGILDRFAQIEPKALLAIDAYRTAGQRTSIGAKLEAVRRELPWLERVIVVPDHSHPEPGLREAALPFSTESVVPYDVYVDRPPEPLTFEQLPFDHPVYILFSSGTTGVPKAIVHGAGGTLLQHLKEHLLHTDLKAGDRLLYLTTCGWMMWNWQVSALATGATIVLYDGSPFHPHAARLFDLCERERVTVFGTSARYIDTLRKAGAEPRRTHDLEDLRAILFTGSPLAPESFDYVYARIKPDLHLASISGGTDIVPCFVLGNPMAPVFRGEIQAPGLGMAVEIWDAEGRPLQRGAGELVCTRPFPSMPVGFWNDPHGDRYRSAYFERFPGVWHHGDRIERTGHGGFVIHGRSDATLNPGGVRIGTAEIYRVVERFDEVLEAVAVGQKWQGDERIVLFVRLREGIRLDDELSVRIRSQILENLSVHHVPARILQVDDIPRTMSGKTAELAVRDVLHGRTVANVEALANPGALDLYRDFAELSTTRPYVAPRDPVERQLVALWEELLGVPQVGIDDDYYELGGNSLTGLEMFLSIEQSFGRSLPLSLLVQAPTVRVLARAITTGPEASPCLVPLQTGGTRTPLFCVHDLSGNVLVYRRLAAHLGPDQPVFGLQYPDQHEFPVRYRSIEDLAARYVDELCGSYPVGPVQLVGYSVGGLIAFEIARRLEAGGRRVVLLASFDGGPPDYPPGRLTRYLDHGLSLLRRPPRAWPAYLRSRFGYWSARRGRTLTGYPVRDGVQTLNPAVQAIAGDLLPRAREAYQPGIWSGDLDLFRCAEDAFLWWRRPDFGWRRYVRGEIRTRDVPATHQGMMSEPALSALARSFQPVLKQRAPSSQADATGALVSEPNSGFARAATAELGNVPPNLR